MPQSAISLDIRDTSISLPEYLLFDASVLLKSGVHQDQAILGFITRAQQAYNNGRSYLLTCLPSLEECYHKILMWEYQKDQNLAPRRTALAAKWTRTPQVISWHELYKDSPTEIKRYSSKLEAFYQWVVHIPIHVVEPEDLATQRVNVSPIEERIRYYTTSACILTKDAWLVAQAERLGVHHIATTDSDFRRLGPDFTLYTIP